MIMTPESQMILDEDRAMARLTSAIRDRLEDTLPYAEIHHSRGEVRGTLWTKLVVEGHTIRLSLPGRLDTPVIELDGEMVVRTFRTTDEAVDALVAIAA